MITIKQLCKIAHEAAIEKGFWKKCSTGEVYQRNISELLMLIVSELGEALEALRNNKRQDELLLDWEKDTFEDELADAVIRICDLAESQGIDLEWQIEQKLNYNKTRPPKHGKEF